MIIFLNPDRNLYFKSSSRCFSDDDIYSHSLKMIIKYKTLVGSLLKWTAIGRNNNQFFVSGFSWILH